MLIETKESMGMFPPYTPRHGIVILAIYSYIRHNFSHYAEAANRGTHLVHGTHLVEVHISHGEVHMLIGLGKAA